MEQKREVNCGDEEFIGGIMQIAPELDAFETVKHIIFSSLGESEHTKQIIVACEEIFANIVNYSGADEVAFRCRQSGDTWSISFADNGIEFDPVTADQVDRVFEDLEFGGMGINIARTISRDMVYSRSDGKNILTMTFDIM